MNMTTDDGWTRLVSSTPMPLVSDEDYGWEFRPRPTAPLPLDANLAAPVRRGDCDPALPYSWEDEAREDGLRSAGMLGFAIVWAVVAVSLLVMVLSL